MSHAPAPAHDWDIAGAAAAGLATAFVARDGRGPLPGAAEPTFTGGGLEEVASLIISRYGAR